MKIILIIVGIIFFAFAAVQIYFMSAQKNIETYPCKVIKTYDNFETREYEASLFTSVKLDEKQYKKASGKGFSILAGYIFGGNEKKEKIAMTSPVAMSLEDTTTMMFMVPKKYNKESLPTPDQSQIVFTEMPAKKVAAISFGGWANDDKIEKHKQKLISALAKEGVLHSDKFYFLGYNAPFEVMNRKNEVIMEL